MRIIRIRHAQAALPSHHMNWDRARALETTNIPYPMLVFLPRLSMTVQHIKYPSEERKRKRKELLKTECLVKHLEMPNFKPGFLQEKSLLDHTEYLCVHLCMSNRSH